MSWYWRTKPRSIVKTIQWFPFFGALEDKNWNDTTEEVSHFNQKQVHPTRREYIYYAHNEEDAWLSTISYDEYLSGAKDTKETESNGRNDKSTFEFFGFSYVDEQGFIHVTESGRQIMQGRFDQERYLKQMLKLHLPNPIQKITSTASQPGIFPMQLVLKAFEYFDSLNRSELALLFGCDEEAQISSMIAAIADFKFQYETLPNKLDTKTLKNIFKQVYESHYGPMTNKISSYYDYAEAFSRSLVYTGLFSISGRSYASKLRVATHAQKKVELLRTQYEFHFPQPFFNEAEYMAWYGSDSNVNLPWDDSKARQEIVKDKIELLQSLLKTEEPEKEEAEFIQMSIEDFLSLPKEVENDLLPSHELADLLTQAQETTNITKLKDIEYSVDKAIIHHNEAHFINVTSKTKEERDFILEKFDDILANDDMSALWLEVNTWKSLISVQGIHTVKRNFQIEEDLSPRSFAPGVGNTPDMELYWGDTILLPEVSLMTGVRQWEHEASSVVDHVMHFMKTHEEKHILGLFLSTRIHLRTMWQFFILNRESWLGKPIPIVPLTIEQYVKLITKCYKKEISMEVLLRFFNHLCELSLHHASYQSWEQAIEHQINQFPKGI